MNKGDTSILSSTNTNTNTNKCYPHRNNFDPLQSNQPQIQIIGIIIDECDNEMISKIEITMTPTIRMASTTTENYGDIRIVIKPIVIVTMTTMITHYVLIVKNTYVIPM